MLIHENAFENIVCETAAILSRPQWVNAIDADLSGYHFVDNKNIKCS